MTKTSRLLATLSLVLALFGVVALGPPAATASHATPRGARAPVPAGITDFNGDGYADLAVTQNQGDAGATANAGGVNVIYGSASGLQTSSPADQYWTANSPGMPPPAAQTQEQFGFSLAIGDFNGDGYSDIAVGAPLVDVDQNGTVVDAGGAYVIYGSANGLQTAAPAAQFFSGATPGMPSPAVPGAYLGRAATAGDFNGDGFADLALGAPRQDISPFTQAGSVYVLYGSTTGLKTAGSQYWTQDSPGVPDNVETSDWFGRALTAGDFNGDGFADLVVGVPLEDHEGVGGQVRKDAGAVNVLYGSSSGVQATSPAAQFFDQDSHHVMDQCEAFDYFGHNLAAGDFNHDGYGDLGIGVRLEDLEGHPTINDAGAVNVLYGSAGGLQTDAPENQFWSQNSKHMHDSADKNEEFGFSLAAADFNGDGFADLAIGVAFENLGLTIQGAGGVNVLYGSAAGLQTDAPENQFWMQGTGGVPDTAEALDEFGFSVAANDYNNDGRADLAIGVTNEDLTNPAVANAGAVNVLYGGSNGLQTVSPPAEFWSQNSPGMPGGAKTGDEFGYWLG